MTLLQRLGLVSWWLGALFGAGLAATMLVAAAKVERNAGEVLIGFTAAILIVTGGLWALAFVLAGSFWRPPKPGPSRFVDIAQK